MDARAACVTNNVKKRSLSLMQQQAANQSRERTCISFGPGSSPHEQTGRMTEEARESPGKQNPHPPGPIPTCSGLYTQRNSLDDNIPEIGNS